MTAQMAEIQRADRPIHHYEIRFVGAGKQQCDVADGAVLETQPYIGRPETSFFVVLVHQQLPSGTVILIAHAIHEVGVVHPALRETELVYRHAADAGDHAAEIFIVLIELGSKNQHGMVEREFGFRGCELAKGVDVAWDPVVLISPGGWRRRRRRLLWFLRRKQVGEYKNQNRQ